jgi:hypothetical protein
VAEEMGLGFASCSLTHHTRQSVLGLPVIKELEDYGKYTQYTMSEIIGMVYQKKQEGYQEGILLLDEFPCVSESILPVMLAFLQTKNIGQYHLPEGWVIVLCGNPPECNRSARRFDAAITDRLRKIPIEFDSRDFLDYATEKGFHESILSYLDLHREHIYLFDDKKGEEELVTCRGWENLSHVLKAYEKLERNVNEALIMQFIKSEKVAYEFNKYYWLSKCGCSEKDVKNIVQGVDQEKYAKQWKEKDFIYLWNVVELLGKHVENGLKASKNTDLNLVSRQVSNVFSFIRMLPSSKQLEEKFYYYIVESQNLVKAMAETKNEDYVAICKKVYRHIA